MKFRFYYTGICVRDLQQSLKFYTKTIDMKIVGKGAMPHGGKYIHLKGPKSQQMLKLNWYPECSRFYTEYRKGDELDHLAFSVKDTKKAFEELVRNGAEVAVSPQSPEEQKSTLKTLMEYG